MAIKISLPKPENICGYKDIKHFLRQLELCVHHASKSLEEMNTNGDINETSYVIYRFPAINLYEREQDDKGFVKVHVDEESDQMQDIEIEIEP